MSRLLLLAFVSALFALHAALSIAADEEADKAAILEVTSRMEAAWNRGDFRGYMDGFANPDVVFISRGEYQKDWQGTLDHYIRDYGASEATRGQLRFYDIRIEMLGPDAAQLNSRFHLERPQNPLDGISTRIFRKRDGKWVIALNHVSARETSAATQDQTAAEKAVWQLEQDYWRFVSAGDVDSYVKLWHDDFVGWPCAQPGPVRKGDIGSWVRDIRDNKWKLTYELKPIDSQEFGGDTVIVHYAAEYAYDYGDGTGSGAGLWRKFTHTWMKTPGGWQIIGGMCAAQEPVAPPRVPIKPST